MAGQPSGRSWPTSLFVRVFALAGAVALLAVAAATWATVRSTTVAVEQEQRESLRADARVYDALLGYATSHRSWAGAAGLVDRLARETGQPVAVTDVAGRTLLDSSGRRADRPPERARAIVDPLDVDAPLRGLAGSSSPAGGSPQASRTTSASTVRLCGDAAGATTAEQCTGYLVAPAITLDPRVLSDVVPRTKRFWFSLVTRVDRCLRREGLDPVLAVQDDLNVVVPYPQRHTAVAGCAARANRAVLSGRVAPRVLLHLGDDVRPTASAFRDLTGGGRVRILLVAGAVLVVTLALCALLAGSIVRPLRRMGETARRASAGDLTARVAYDRPDEIGDVARAFNEMADRRVQLEEARRRLVGDVSHDLRTPVSTLRGWLEAAQDGLVEPDQELMASLHEETLHLQQLVEDLHQVALGDAGQLRMRLEPTDLSTLVEHVGASFRHAATEAGVTLAVDAQQAPPLHLDRLRLRQAVENLITNALRHTPPGGRVDLRADGRTVSVTDTGEGIPADELPHVFDRFRRVDPSRSRLTGGSGLGLAIVRQIAEAHGGSATIASTAGAGTTVTLRL